MQYDRHRYSYWTIERETPKGNRVFVPGGHSIASTGHARIIGRANTYYRGSHRGTLGFNEIKNHSYPSDIINPLEKLHENRNKDQKRLRFGATIIEAIISFNDFLLSGTNKDKASVDWIHSHYVNAALCMQHVLESKLPVASYINRSKKEEEEYQRLSKRERDRIDREGTIQVDTYDNGSNVKTYRCSESKFKIPYLYCGIPIRRKGIVSRFMASYMHRDGNIKQLYNDVIKEINEYSLQLFSHMKVEDAIAGETKTPNDILKEILNIDYFHEYNHLIDGARSSRKLGGRDVDAGVSIQGCMQLSSGQEINALLLKFFLSDLEMNFDQLKIFKNVCEEVSKFVDNNIVNMGTSINYKNNTPRPPLGLYNLMMLGVDPNLLDLTNGGTEIHILPMQNLIDRDHYTFIVKQRMGYDMSHDAVSYAYGNDLKKHKYSTVSKCYDIDRGWYSFWWGGVCCGIGRNGSNKHRKRCGHTDSWHVYGATTFKNIKTAKATITPSMTLEQMQQNYAKMLSNHKHQAKLVIEVNHAVPVYSSTSIVRVNKSLFNMGKLEQAISIDKHSVLEASNDIFKPFVFNNQTNEFVRYCNYQVLNQEELLKVVGRDFEVGTETLDRAIEAISKFEQLLRGR